MSNSLWWGTNKRDTYDSDEMQHSLCLVTYWMYVSSLTLISKSMLRKVRKRERMDGLTDGRSSIRTSLCHNGTFFSKGHMKMHDFYTIQKQTSYDIFYVRYIHISLQWPRMSLMACKITGVANACLTKFPDKQQRNHLSSPLLGPFEGDQPVTDGFPA